MEVRRATADDTGLLLPLVEEYWCFENIAGFEPARGGGIGERLLREAEAEFAAIGCTNVSLQLGRANDAARNFYSRRGYHPRAGFELLDKNLSAS